MKRTISLITILIAAILLTSCADTAGGLGSTQSSGVGSDDDAKISVSGESYPLTITDYFGYETTLEKLPERVAVLSGTPLNIWYDLGGKSICSSDISDGNLKLVEEYAQEMRALPTVGKVYSLDMEKVIAEKPDLVITQAGVQTEATQTLRDMGIPVISTFARSFDDVVALYRVFGVLLGQEELAGQKIEKLTSSRQSYIDQAPDDGKSVVILYLTSNSLSVKLDNSIAGDIAKSLKIKNIASGLPADTVGSENTPMDIEYIVEQDPDMVLVTSMIGSNELAVETMENQFSSNQAWQSVKAISEGRVAYLPQEYFLYNCGPYYDEAVRYMACCVYPEIFGEVSEWYGK